MRRALAWIVLLIILPIVAVTLSACRHAPLTKSDAPSATPIAASIQSQVKTGIEANETTRKHIESAAAKAPEIKPEAEAAVAANTEQNKAFYAIDAERVKLVELQEKLDVVIAERDVAYKRAVAAESQANLWRDRTLVGIQIAAGLAVAVSIALMIWGTLRTALPTIIAAAVFVATFVIQVSIEHRLLIGLGCGIVTVGALVWQLWINKKSFAQVVKTVDETIRDADDALPDAFKKNAELVQSKLTKALIDGAQGNGAISKARRWLANFIGPKKA